MSSSIGSIKAIYIDVSDVGQGGEFWGRLLGLIPEPERQDSDGGTFRNLQDEDGKTPIVLQRSRDPHTSTKNRIHLDIEVADLGVAVHSVKRIGGSVVAHMAPPDGRFMVMADPDGNEFCLVT